MRAPFVFGSIGMGERLNAAILGASGYTGADMVRLALAHPHVRIAALGGDSKAGLALAETFPHLGFAPLPTLQRAEEIAWDGVDVVFGCLPHGASEQILSGLAERIAIIDLSADFRLKRPEVYAEWYGREHGSPHLLAGAVYGLTEWARPKLRSARLAACPGCYPTAVLLALLPLVHGGVISLEDVIIDAKSGVSGAGRGLKEANLFCEAGESLQPYGVGRHRHMPEMEQELGLAAGQDVRINFTPHLAPMSRGELVTCHVRLRPDRTLQDARDVLRASTKDEPFVHLAPPGLAPSTRHVRGSNHCLINVFEDRLAGRIIVIAAIDNLVKGSAGQALQNCNVMFGFPETAGLEQAPLFP
jgi:N-acetyl-gamma-glutamyl-phosphate reductase